MEGQERGEMEEVIERVKLRKENDRNNKITKSKSTTHIIQSTEALNSKDEERKGEKQGNINITRCDTENQRTPIPKRPGVGWNDGTSAPKPDYMYIIIILYQRRLGGWNKNWNYVSWNCRSEQ